MFETKRGSQCLGGIKMLGRDLSGWGWNRRGCGQVWAGRVPGGDSPGGCFGGTFGAFITFGWFLRWSFLFVHSSYFQQREHIVWCRCVARFLSLFPSIKGIGSFWMSTLKPYKRVSVFRLLSSNFCFCAELWSDRHRLLSFQEADFFFFFFFFGRREEKSDWSQDPWQDSLWKGVTHTFHISIKEGGWKLQAILKADTLTLNKRRGLTNVKRKPCRLKATFGKQALSWRLQFVMPGSPKASFADWHNSKAPSPSFFHLVTFFAVRRKVPHSRAFLFCFSVLCKDIHTIIQVS